MMKEPLNREAAEQIFKQEAICFGGRDAIPQYRVIELFGEHIAYFMEENMGYHGLLELGRDYSGVGSGTEERPFLTFFMKEGFIKIVSEHNYLYYIAAHAESDAGRIADDLWRKRIERIEREDAEAAAREEAKKQERKAKREAAKAAKAAREAAEKESSGGEKHNAEAKG